MLSFKSTVKCPFKRFTCIDTALTCADDVSLPPVCSIPTAIQDCPESTAVPYCIVGLLSELYLLAAGFMVFAMFIMPKLKVDPEEMKEMLGQKETAPEKEKAPAIKGRQHR